MIVLPSMDLLLLFIVKSESYLDLNGSGSICHGRTLCAIRMNQHQQHGMPSIAVDITLALQQHTNYIEGKQTQH